MSTPCHTTVARYYALLCECPCVRHSVSASFTLSNLIIFLKPFIGIDIGNGRQLAHAKILFFHEASTDAYTSHVHVSVE